jgi:hypothetical protein
MAQGDAHKGPVSGNEKAPKKPKNLGSLGGVAANLADGGGGSEFEQRETLLDKKIGEALEAYRKLDNPLIDKIPGFREVINGSETEIPDINDETLKPEQRERLSKMLESLGEGAIVVLSRRLTPELMYLTNPASAGALNSSAVDVDKVRELRDQEEEVDAAEGWYLSVLSTERVPGSKQGEFSDEQKRQLQEALGDDEEKWQEALPSIDALSQAALEGRLPEFTGYFAGEKKGDEALFLQTDYGGLYYVIAADVNNLDDDGKPDQDGGTAIAWTEKLDV